MAGNYGDPKVRGWMREHPEKVERVERLYGALKAYGDFTELLRLAYDLGVDVERHEEQAKGKLIADIIRTAPERALELVSGQGVLRGAGGR